MEIKILFKNTSYLLTTRAIKFLVGFVRTKLIAVFLGTFGTGIISQINQLTELMARFTVSGMSDGLVKNIAESDKDNKAFRNNLAVAIKTYIAIITLFLAIFITLSLVFKDQLTTYFFGDDRYSEYFYIGLVTFPMLVINGISFAILRSFKQIKYIARSELIGILINLVIFFPLIYIWRLWGAGIYVAFAYLTVLILNHHYAKVIILKSVNLKLSDILHAQVSRRLIKELFVFAGFGMTAGISLILSDSVTRAIVINQLGINKIGIYSPVMIWTSLFAGLIIPSISTYLYPRYCECKSDHELGIVMNDSLKFVSLLMIPVIFLSIPVRFQLIPIVYSKEFTVAGTYLPWHLLGTLFFMWMSIFDQAMKPTGRIRAGGIIVIVMCVIDIVVVYLLVPVIGLYAFMLKFIISPVIFFFYYVFYWKHEIKYELESKLLLIMLYIITGFAAQMMFEKYISANYKLNFLAGISLTGLSVLLLNKYERSMILNKIKNIRQKYSPGKINLTVKKEEDIPTSLAKHSS